MQKKRYLVTAAILFSILGFYTINTLTHAESKKMETNSNHQHIEIATFSGGCFWCSESDFEKADGVIEVVSGFTGGTEENPSYKDVASGKTSHLEAVQVRYHADKITYREILDVFWKHIDPTDSGGQFVDRGPQYRTAIFYHTEEQKQLAEASKKALARSGIFDKPIVTEILPYTSFYRAEEYHQDYYKKNPIRYNFYRYRSGRDQYIESVWTREAERKLASPQEDGSTPSRYIKPDDDTIREKLSPLAYKVTQQDGTEPPFNNRYWDNKKEGIYVDIVSGEPLFSSRDKFESGTGWPSFTRPIDKKFIVEVEDRSLFMTRTEVRSRYGDSHLGHVFPDGPPPTGLRYCINSASLRFIPKAELAEKGYEAYLDALE